MEPQIKPSQRASIVGAVNPQSTSTTVTSGWIDATTFHNYLALISTGVLGASATVDAKLQQATDSGGTGAKDVTSKSITQLVKASNDNNQALINLKQEDLDFANAFKFFRLSITVGTAASLVSATILGFDPRQGAASSNAAATQVQAVA